MAKPAKRQRLASRAGAAKVTQNKDVPNASVTGSIEPIQETKNKKRQVRHDAFLKKIQEKKPTKRIRKRSKKKQLPNLLSLGAELDEIMTADRERRSKKMEASVGPNGKQIRQEIERFRAVMQHPGFKANPLKAIRQHVENTWERKDGMSL